MSLDSHWFTEIDKDNGTAFSVQTKAKLHEEQTPYQHITIYSTMHFGHLMVIDGFIMLSERDHFFYHEMITHPVLFTHSDPRRIIIVGGGDCGTLREVLKHPTVKSVLQVEIDERVTRLAEQYFPTLCESNQDPRAHFHFADAVQWMAQAPAHSADVIIVDSTDPLGPGEGLFTTSFYQECRRVLTPGGLLAQQSEFPLLHLPLLQSMHKAMRQAGFASTRTLQFPQCVYPSGWWSVTIAGNDSLTQFRVEEARDKPFTTQFYHVDMHQASFVLPSFLKKALAI